MNTEIASNGAEIYTNKLFKLSDQYINERLEGNEEKVPNSFRDMIYYLADRIEKPDNEDIDALDCLFGAYVRLCARYRRIPTLECFSWLVKIDRNTFTDWAHERYRATSEHSSTVKKWLSVCKGCVIDELSNAKFANPNLIFIAKAAHGMRETSPIPAEETHDRRIMMATELPQLKADTDKNTAHAQLPHLGDVSDHNITLPWLADTEPNVAQGNTSLDGAH